MADTVYITGHRNPDSDSICSAIAYADLKNRVSDLNAVPIRQGELNRETKFILEYFKVSEPILKDTMKLKVSDLDFDKAYKVSKDIPMYKALLIMQKNSISGIQVVDDTEKLIGMVNLSNLTKGYLDIWDDNILGRSNTSIDNIVEVLSAKVLFKPEKITPLTGRMTVYAMEPENIEDRINKRDIVIVGNREDAQKDAILKGVSLLILTINSGMSEENLKLAKENNVTVISTALDTFLASRLLPLSVPIEYVMTKENLVTFEIDDYVDDIKVVMGNTRFREYPIVNHNKKTLGSIARYHLISSKKTSLILVDHNERNQSVKDMDAAEIVEIIDHHRVANVITANPVFFRNEPVGSTATIISKMFFEQGVSPSQQIAGILASAIISDTLLLRSPTVTDDDRRMLDRMAKIANIDVEKYAHEMFRAGTSLDGKTAEDLLNGDVKNFEIENEKIRIAQIFTMDMDSIENIKDEILKLMKEFSKNDDSTQMLAFTDIIKENSKILVAGKFEKEIAGGFGKELKDNSFSADGVLSRKKQIVPIVNRVILEEKSNKKSAF